MRNLKNISRRLYPALVVLAAWALCLPGWASNPSPGPHNNGDFWVNNQTGGSTSTCDTLMGSGSAVYTGCTVWKWTGAGTQQARWIYAPAGTTVTFSAAFVAGGNYDILWSGLLGGNYPPSYTAAVQGSSGAVSSPFAGIAATANQPIQFYADAGTHQLNRGETAYGAGSGVPGTLYHTRFQSSMSHAIVAWPPEGFNISAAGGFAPVWDGELLGDFEMGLWDRYRLVNELFTDTGVRVWASDPMGSYYGYPIETDLDEFTASGQHLQNKTPHADNPVPSLAGQVGHNMLLKASVQGSHFRAGGWTSWQVEVQPDTTTYIEAERLIHIVP